MFISSKRISSRRLKGMAKLPLTIYLDRPICGGIRLNRFYIENQSTETHYYNSVFFGLFDVFQYSVPFYSSLILKRDHE